MERLIESIKTDFETEVAATDKRLVQLRKLNGDLFNLTQQTIAQMLKEKNAAVTGFALFVVGEGIEKKTSDFAAEVAAAAAGQA